MAGNTETQWHDLLVWYHTTYIMRTVAIEQDKGFIHWLDEGSRVSWTEVCSTAEELGMDISNIVQFRLDFDRRK